VEPKIKPARAGTDGVVKKLAKNNFSHLNLPNFSTVISERSGEILLFWIRGDLSLRFPSFEMTRKKNSKCRFEKTIFFVQFFQDHPPNETIEMQFFYIILKY
jgi:hypothetical protein